MNMKLKRIIFVNLVFLEQTPDLREDMIVNNETSGQPNENMQ